MLAARAWGCAHRQRGDVPCPAGGAAADSRALQADALDFLGDAGNYAVSCVAGTALSWRARAALLKSLFMLGFAGWVFGSAVFAFMHLHFAGPCDDGRSRRTGVANVGVAPLLYRYRTGDANMRSVWICSRNDAIGNVAVMLAALGVFGTGSAWPDLIVATIMAAGLDGRLAGIPTRDVELEAAPLR